MRFVKLHLDASPACSDASEFALHQGNVPLTLHRDDAADLLVKMGCAGEVVDAEYLLHRGQTGLSQRQMVQRELRDEVPNLPCSGRWRIGRRRPVKGADRTHSRPRLQFKIALLV